MINDVHNLSKTGGFFEVSGLAHLADQNFQGKRLHGGGYTFSLQEHLALYLQRVRLLVQRYMRRYAERLLQADGSYSDLCVGPQELRKILHIPSKPAPQEWLESLGIPPLEDLEEAISSQKAEMNARLMTLSEDLILPIEELRAGFHLTPEELDLLMLAAAPRLNMDIARLYAVAWADYSIRQPTASFLAELAAPSKEKVPELLSLLHEHKRLFRFQLLTSGQHDLWKPHTPRLHAPMIVPQRIIDYLSGDLVSQTNIPGCQITDKGLPPADLVLAPEHRATLLKALRRSQPRVCLVGSVGSGRGTIVKSFTARAGQKLLSVDLAQALTPTGEPVLVQLAKLLREARLHHGALLFRLDDMGDHPFKETLRAKAPQVLELIQEYPGPLFLTTTEKSLATLFVRDLEPLIITPPKRAGQEDLWNRALKDVVPARDAARMAQELSQSYRLPPGSIYRAVETSQDHDARRSSRGPRAMSMQRLLESIRRQFDHNLGWLAEAVIVNMTLDDVVLSEETREQVQEILMYARHSEMVFEKWRFADRSPSGQGMPVLFSGPPGTGKTLLAGVLARELGRALYKVDLSRIVDKYIGETEKNLARVFDEAERAQAMLLFDEADSLFAKRTSVKSSNDRYANLEVNFLLQRLESFNGMSILTTNFAASIDEAFQRRIRFKIAFPMPDDQLRAKLWEQLMPPEAPLSDDVEWDLLGEGFKFTGGHIRNAVLRAAVQAASQGSSITHEMLVNAGVAESREMGTLVRDEDVIEP